MPSSYRRNHATSGDIRIHEITLSPKCRKPTSPWQSVHRSCCTYLVDLSTTYLSVEDAPDVTPSASSNPADTVCVLADRVLDRLLFDVKEPEVCGWMCSSNSKNREYRRRNHSSLVEPKFGICPPKTPLRSTISSTRWHRQSPCWQQCCMPRQHSHTHNPSSRPVFLQATSQ